MRHHRIMAAWLTGSALAAVAIFLLAMPAQAQGPRPRPTGDAVKDIKTLIGGQGQGSDEAAQTSTGGTKSSDKLAQILAKPFNDLADFINSDTAAAVTLSTAIPELQDGHGQQCWMAMGQFTSVLKAHPIPVTLHAATDLEAFRLAAMAANNLCHNSSCNQIFTDLANSIQKAAPVNLGIPIPSLSSLCAYVPQVTVMPPVTAAAPKTP